MRSEWTEHSLLPHAQFSDCGTYILLRSVFGLQTWFQVFQQLPVDPSTPRFIRLKSHYAIENNISGRDYSFTSVSDTGIAFADFSYIKADKQGFYDETVHRPVYLYNICSYSSSLTNADRFLLLGENDNEEMRLLTVPHDERVPEIMPLSLTFAEAQLRLCTEWEREHPLKVDRQKLDARFGSDDNESEDNRSEDCKSEDSEAEEYESDREGTSITVRGDIPAHVLHEKWKAT